MTLTKHEIFTFSPIYGIAEAETAGKYYWPFIPVIKYHKIKHGNEKEVKAKLLSLEEFIEFYSFTSFDEPNVAPKEIDGDDSAAKKDAATKEITAVDEIKKTEWKPANDSELFGFAAKYPEEQKNGPILAPGTILMNSKGRPSIFYLSASVDKERRHLGIVQLKMDSDENFEEIWVGKFLVVHR